MAASEAQAQHQLQAAQNELTSQAQQVQRMEHQVSASEGQIAVLRRRIEERDGQISSLEAFQRSLSGQENETQSVVAKATALHLAECRLRSELTFAARDNAVLQDECRMAQTRDCAKTRVSESELQAQANVITQLRCAGSRLQEQLEEANRANAHLIRQLEGAETRLKQEKDLASELNEKVASMRATVALEQGRVHRLEAELAVWERQFEVQMRAPSDAQ